MVGFFLNLLYEQFIASVPEVTTSFAHKTVIVTGANSGLGKEAARQLAGLGCARLILGVRNVKAGEEARADILATTGVDESRIAVWQVDLGSFTSVGAFADRANRELDRLDALICNAGINTTKYAELEGYESMLTVNVLSTFLMATRFLPLLEQTASKGPVAGDPDPRPPHLAVVSSDTHLMVDYPERNEPSGKLLAAISSACKQAGPRANAQYATTKLFEVLLVRDMVYRQHGSGPSTGTNAVPHPEDRYPVVINSLTPGLCHSNLIRDTPLTARIIHFIFNARSTDVGAHTLVHAAAAGWESNGQFLSSGKVHPGSALSWDREVAENLWRAVEAAIQTES